MDTKVQSLVAEIEALSEAERQALAQEVLPLLLSTRAGLEEIDRSLEALSDEEPPEPFMLPILRQAPFNRILWDSRRLGLYVVVSSVHPCPCLRVLISQRCLPSLRSPAE